MAISIFKPSIKRKDMDAVLTCLVGDSVSYGEASQSFVKRVSDYLGIQGGFAMRKYFDALKLALSSLSLEKNARILISPLSPAVYLHVIQDLGFQVVYADVDLGRACFTKETLASAIEAGIDAILLHESLGFVPPIDDILDTGFPVIEDVSMSLGASNGEGKCGSFGNFTVLHTEAEGIITSGGGALVLARDKKTFAALKKQAECLDSVDFMTDMNASLGETQMAEIERFIEKRYELAQIYRRNLMKTRHKVLIQDGDAENVYYSFPVVLEGSLKETIKYALKKNVETHMAFFDCALSRYEPEQQEFPNAKALMLRTLLFPLYPMLGKNSIETIGKVLSTLP